MLCRHVTILVKLHRRPTTKFHQRRIVNSVQCASKSRCDVWQNECKMNAPAGTPLWPLPSEAQMDISTTLFAIQKMTVESIQVQQGRRPPTTRIALFCHRTCFRRTCFLLPSVRPPPLFTISPSKMSQWMKQVQVEKLDVPLLAGGIIIGVLWLLRARRNSVGAQSNEPPVLPYWIPWLGHALSYASGSDKVFRAARYGSLKVPRPERFLNASY